MKAARTLLLSTLGWALLAGAAGAGEIPSPWWQAHMNDSFSELPYVRLRGPLGSVVIREPSVDSTGVRYSSIETSPAFYQGKQAASQPGEVPQQMISWSEIDRIEKPVRATGFGALIGGVIGAALAVAVGASDELDQESDSSEIIPAVIIVGGLGIGAVVGSGMTRWELYYPQPVRGIKTNTDRASRAGEP